MATPDRKDRWQHWIVKLVPVATLIEAQDLANRYHEGEGFRFYILERKRLVIPAVLVIVLISIVCAAGTVVFLAGAHGLLTLLALVLTPVILIGSLFVQVFVFFSWLEERALKRALQRRATPAHGTLAEWLSRKLDMDMGTIPRVPWILAAVFVFAPLAMLAYFALDVALVSIGFAILVPILYARFDR